MISEGCDSQLLVLRWGVVYLTVLAEGRNDRELLWEYGDEEWRLVYFLFKKFIYYYKESISIKLRIEKLKFWRFYFISLILKKISRQFRIDVPLIFLETILPSIFVRIFFILLHLRMILTTTILNVFNAIVSVAWWSFLGIGLVCHVATEIVLLSAWFGGILLQVGTWGVCGLGIAE